MFRMTKENAQIIRLLNTLIENQIQLIDQRARTYGTSNVGLKKVLLQLHVFLADIPENESGMNVIRVALNYLAQLKIDQGMLYSDKAIGVILSESGKHVPVDADIMNDLREQGKQQDIYMPTDALQEDDVPILSKLCSQLLSIKPEPVWEYTYEKDSTGQVMNEAVALWLEIMNASGVKDEAYRDFKRDSQIADKGKFKLVSNSQVKDALKELTTSASAYKKSDQAKLLQWLEAKGGQRSNNFVALLIQNGDFSAEDKLEFLRLKSLLAHWFVEDGKICQDQEIIVSALSITNQQRDLYLIAKNSGSVIRTHETRALEEDQTKVMPSPLIRVRARIELDIDNGKVVPKITNLHVSGYTSQLQSPKEKYEAKKSETPRRPA